MTHKNWTLVVGCSAFLLVGIVATLTGASIQTATFRAVVASCIGGICGFFLDYFFAHSPAPSPPSAPAGSAPHSSERQTETRREIPAEDNAP